MGVFTAQLLGTRGDWVVCWPSQVSTAESLMDFALSLAQDFRVVICDSPGLGDNQGVTYTNNINELTYLAHRMLSKLGIERCHWVGHSAGGVIGASIHVALPARLISLTLASTPMLSQGRFKLHVAAGTALLSGSRLGRRLLASRASHETGSSDAQEKALVSAYLTKTFEKASPKTLSSMRPLDGASVRRTFERLRANQLALLVLCGRHDAIVLPRDQRTVAEIMQANFVDLDCGHMSLLVQPDACAHAFKRFVQNLPRRSDWRETKGLPFAA